MSSSSLNSPWCLTRILGHEVFKCHDTRALGAPEQAQQRLLWPCLSATASTKAAACGGCRHALGARLRLYPLAKYDGALVRANEHDGFAFYGVRDAPTASKWLAMNRILKWDTISHMYKALTLIVVPIHRIEVLVNWFSIVSSRLSFFLVMTKSDLEDMSGLKTCYVPFSAPDRFTDPGMVDLCTFMVDPSVAFSADEPIKLMGFVPLVDALLLSNPIPILQLDDF
ncbi:hypothetical protein Tco_0588987 [Tanacetum coccineum]